MIKKYIVAISTVFILVFLLFLAILQEGKFKIFNPVSLAVAEEIWTEKERVERFEFKSLMCNGMQVPVDYIEKTFYVPLNMESDEWETIEFSSGNSEFLICFSEDFTQRNKRELIASGESIEFLVYNETQFSTYHIIFTGLPIIDIATIDGFKNQQNIEGHAVFYNTNFLTRGIEDSSFYGHVRGNTSTLYPKKGYKINLTKQMITGEIVKNKLSLFDMREDDDWILYALYNDETKFRAKLAVDLWNEFGSKEIVTNSIYNTNMNYVELIVDEAYYGLYAIMEPIDGKQLNLDYNDYLYKREQPAELTKEGFEQSNHGETEILGFELKSGELKEDAWIPLAELTDVMNAPDKEFMDKIGNIVDLNNAIRLWLYIQVITGVDQGVKNVFYVARESGENYRFTFAPWDLDLTWGNTSANEEPYYTKYDFELKEKGIRWQPGNRLIKLNVEASAEKMQKLYMQLRSSSLSNENLERRIASIDHILRDSGAYDREKVRWPEAASAEDYSQVLEFAKERMNYLDTALFNLESFLNEK